MDKFVYLYDSKAIDSYYINFYFLSVISTVFFGGFVYFDELILERAFIFSLVFQMIILILSYWEITRHHSYDYLLKYLVAPVNSLLGTFFFGKIMATRNYPRWDFIIFRLALPFIFFAFMISVINHYFLQTSSLKWVYGFLGGFYIASIWHIYNRKSSQYATAYQTALIYTDEKTNFSIENIHFDGSKVFSLKKSKLRAEYYACILAIDLIHFDLWNHKSFSTFFYNFVLKLHNSDNPSESLPSFLDIQLVKQYLYSYSLELDGLIADINKNNFDQAKNNEIYYKLAS